MTIDMNLVVIGLFIFQVLGLLGVAWALWRIKKGPVAAVQARITPLVDGGKSLAETGKSFAALAPRVKALGESAVTTKEALQLAPPPAGMLLTPQRILQGVGFAKSARTTLKTLKARKLPAKKPSLVFKTASKMGLVPPAAKHLGTAVGIAKTAVKVLRQARKR
jgi:hypothetical protein